jgi:pentatricopeptide repeat protein
MATRNVASWNAMILGHVKCGQAQNALELSRKMQQEGVQLNAVTFVGILNACASIAALEEGRHVHEQIVQNGFESNVFVSNSLIDMYAKCGAIDDAQRVFNKMPTHDIGTCEMWASSQGIATISSNAARRGEARPCYVCGAAQCMC